MDKEELRKKIAIQVENVTIYRHKQSQEVSVNTILALCEPYYREKAKEAVKSLDWNYHLVADDALESIDKHMGGE